MAKGISGHREPGAIPFRWALRLGLLFCVLVALKWHGFSFPAWNHTLRNADAPEVILGQAQGIRSDEWLAILPMIHAQAAHNPPFPVRNTLYGYPDTNTLVGYPTPAYHWTTLFRPALWGYFIGPDTGMAWQWWSRLLLLFFAGCLVLRAVGSERKKLLSAGGWIWVAAPFFVFWSYDREPLVSLVIFIFLGFRALMQSTRLGSSLGWMLFMTWCGLCFVFGTVYPAYQITLGYLLVSLIAGQCARWWIEREIPPRLLLKLVLCGLSVLILGYFLWDFVGHNRTEIEILAHTDYPGARFLTGGRQSLAAFFLNDLIVFSKQIDWKAAGNICEGSGFILFFPFTILWGFTSQKCRKDPLFWTLSIYILTLTAWCLVGFSPLLSKVTLFSKIPESRTWIGLGAADLLLIALWFGKSEPVRKPQRLLWLLLVAAFVGIGISGSHLHPDLITPKRWIAGVIFVSIIAWGFLHRRRWALPSLAFVLVFSTLWFNPLVKGGFDTVARHPLSSKIRQAQTELPGRWAVFDDGQRANLLRMIGIPAINGVHFYPALPLWKAVDPESQQRSIYNRYAHVSLIPLPAGSPHRIDNPWPDVVRLHMDPEDMLLDTWGVQHLLIQSDEPLTQLKNSKKWRWVASEAGCQIYTKATR